MHLTKESVGCGRRGRHGPPHQFEKRGGHHCWDRTEGRLPALTGHVELARWALHNPPLRIPHALYAKGQCLLPTGKKSKLAKFFSRRMCLCEADPQAECTEAAVLATHTVTFCLPACRTAATQHPGRACSVSAAPGARPSQDPATQVLPRVPTGLRSLFQLGPGAGVSGHAVQSCSAFPKEAQVDRGRRACWSRRSARRGGRNPVPRCEVPQGILLCLLLRMVKSSEPSSAASG